MQICDISALWVGNEETCLFSLLSQDTEVIHLLVPSWDVKQVKEYLQLVYRKLS